MSRYFVSRIVFKKVESMNNNYNYHRRTNNARKEGKTVNPYLTLNHVFFFSNYEIAWKPHNSNTSKSKVIL